MGLGGGFVLTIYNRANTTTETLIARERAPGHVTAETFKNVVGPIKGMMSVAVPGELKGYWELHQKYGRLPWRMLIEPSIALCEHGHVVTEYLGWVLNNYKNEIAAEPSLREIFINPETNRTWSAGEKIKRPALAKTLETIANEGVDALYSQNGTVVNVLVDEIQALGGIITVDDFVNYRVDWEAPVIAQLPGGNKLYSVPLPASGGVLALILEIMQGYAPEKTVLYLHRMIESFKFAYGYRTRMGDPDFVPYMRELVTNMTDPLLADEIRTKINDDRTYQDYKHYGGQYSIPEDYGTAHISVYTANGDAVSVTSTINKL